MSRRSVDWAKVGRSSVRQRATGMTATATASATATEAAAAPEEARLQQHLERDREGLSDDERGPAEVAEWGRIVKLLATGGGGYDPTDDAVVQDELAADVEHERAQQRQDEQRCQGQEAGAVRSAALAPDPGPRTPDPGRPSRLVVPSQGTPTVLIEV